MKSHRGAVDFRKKKQAIVPLRQPRGAAMLEKSGKKDAGCVFKRSMIGIFTLIEALSVPMCRHGIGQATYAPH
jgi:hypothetical protein